MNKYQDSQTKLKISVDNLLEILHEEVELFKNLKAL